MRIVREGERERGWRNRAGQDALRSCLWTFRALSLIGRISGPDIRLAIISGSITNPQ